MRYQCVFNEFLMRFHSISIQKECDVMKCVCMGCTEATGRSWDCHTRCDGYKEFQAKNEEEKNVIKRKNPYYKSLSKEKFMKRNALNRNRRGRK